jgi:hypothetical protein
MKTLLCGKIALKLNFGKAAESFPRAPFFLLTNLKLSATFRLCGRPFFKKANSICFVVTCLLLLPYYIHNCNCKDFFVQQFTFDPTSLPSYQTIEEPNLSLFNCVSYVISQSFVISPRKVLEIF